MRISSINRETSETQISCTLALDGSGQQDIQTGCGFLNHMLELFAKHGRFNIKLQCTGDVEVDYHHTVEDVGIVLGRAFSQALGNRVGIIRYGSFLLPMDEALAMVALDISGRPLLCWEAAFPTEKIGDFDTQLVQEFFMAFCRELGATAHIRQFAGANSHHIAEAVFKGFSRALRQAVSINAEASDEVPSSKGTIL